MTEEHMHPVRSRSGGTCVRMDWGTDHHDTIGWQNVPDKGDYVKRDGIIYRVNRRIFDVGEPDCITLELEAV